MYILYILQQEQGREREEVRKLMSSHRFVQKPFGRWGRLKQIEFLIGTFFLQDPDGLAQLDKNLSLRSD